MMILFIAIAIVGFVYFTVSKRQFDFLALAYFSAGFYFIPGFVGYAGYPSGGGFDPVPIHPATYGVMILVLLALLLSAVVFDQFPRPPVTARPSGEIWLLLTPLLTLLALLGLVLSLATIGLELFSADKFSLLSKLNRWFLLWTTSATLGFVLAASRRNHLLMAVNLSLLLLTLYIGFRVEIIVALLAFATIRMAEAGPQRLYRHWKIGIGVVVLGLGLFVYKYLLFAIKLNDWSLVAEQIENPDAVRLIFFQSEPFIILGVLNEVMRQGLDVGMSHLAASFYLLLPFANELGAQFVGFEELFRPKLFSSVTNYGIGSNIWAEMISSGGWPFLILFTVSYALILNMGRALLSRLSIEWSAIIAVTLVYWAFYIHRNDLLFQLTLTRRVLLTAATCAIVSAVWILASRNERRIRTSHA